MAFIALEPRHATAIRSLIEDWCGIAIDDQRSNMLSFRLHPLLEEYKCRDYDDFLRLVKGHGQGIRDAVIDAFTTNETSWFRDPGVYDTLRDEIIPELVEANKNTSSGLDLWSAACSTGQDPYTLAMLLHEVARDGKIAHSASGATEILATDISPAALAIAKCGRFDPVSMQRGLATANAQRYFDMDGKSSVAKSELKSMIRFSRMNLTDAYFGQGRYDLILMRNVLIYFTDEMKSQILENAYHALRPHGILFIGAAEDARRLSKNFKTGMSKSSMYFHKQMAA